MCSSRLGESIKAARERRSARSGARRMTSPSPPSTSAVKTAAIAAAGHRFTEDQVAVGEIDAKVLFDDSQVANAVTFILVEAGLPDRPGNPGSRFGSQGSLEKANER